jgi:hypothetical protein
MSRAGAMERGIYAASIWLHPLVWPSGKTLVR